MRFCPEHVEKEVGQIPIITLSIWEIGVAPKSTHQKEQYWYRVAGTEPPDRAESNGWR